MRLRSLLGALALTAGVLGTPSPAPAQVYYMGPAPFGIPSLVVVTYPYYPFYTTPVFFPQPVTYPPAVVVPPAGGGYGGQLGVQPGAQQGFYLDRSRFQGTTSPGQGATTRPTRPREQTRQRGSALETARRQIIVERSEPGLYRIRWTGADANIAEIEYRALDARGGLLRSRVVSMPPFRGLLRVPEETASIQVIVTREDGGTQSFQLPAAEFRSLAGG